MHVIDYVESLISNVGMCDGLESMQGGSKNAVSHSIDSMLSHLQPGNDIECEPALVIHFQLQSYYFPKHPHSHLQNIIGEIKHRVVKGRLLYA